MKIAAIDLGSNSIHMVIVEVGASGAFRVVDRESEMVRLGAGTLSTGVLTEDAVQRAITILKAYRRLAEIHGVEEILAVSTSAVREARNGEDFLDTVGRKTGIVPRAIPGEEEARLVHLAARNSIRLDGRRALVLDIGGGSLELALSRRDGELILARSEKLGVLRMTERFLKTDPPAPRAVSRLQAFVEATLEQDVRKIRRAGFDVVVGTSGTILSLGRLAYEAATGRRPEALHHLSVPGTAFRAVRRRLVKLDLRERLKIPGLDRRRADIIVAGAVVLDTLIELVGAKTVILCEWALREGILLDYIQGHRQKIARAEALPDVRRRSVFELAERCLYDEAHCRCVATLALELFDGTRRRHGLGAEERSLLEFAALLHDVGHHIAQTAHHKHSYYLIKNGGLRGFEPEEIEIIANVARYHRRSAPRSKHAAFAELPKSARRKVGVLSGLLRLADGLDRSHRQRVRSVSVGLHRGAIEVRCGTVGEAELETWGAGKRLELMERTLGTPVRISFERARRSEGRRTAARRNSRRAESPLRPRIRSGRRDAPSACEGAGGGPGPVQAGNARRRAGDMRTVL